MLIKKTLVVGLGDDLTSKVGLRIKDWNWATPCTWYNKPDLFTFNILAHDILEHIGKQSGTPEDELRAYGAILYGRYNQGMINNTFYSPENVLGTDIGSFVIPTLLEPKRYIQNQAVVEIFEYMKEPLVKSMQDTYSDDMYKPSELFFKKVIHYLSLGYIQAERRYKSSGLLGSLYHYLQHELLDKLKYESLEEINKVFITINTDSQDINVRVSHHTY